MSQKTFVHKRLKAPIQTITWGFPFSEDTKGIPRSRLLGIVLKAVTLPLGSQALHITPTNKVRKSFKALERNLCREITNLLSNVATENQRTCSLNSLQRGQRVWLAPSRRSGLRGICLYPTPSFPLPQTLPKTVVVGIGFVRILGYTEGRGLP